MHTALLPVARLRATFLVLAALLGAIGDAAIAKDKEIDPNFLAMKDCPNEPSCPALILLDQIELSNEKLQARNSHRQMIKVFTQEGIDKYSDVDVTSLVGSDDVRNLDGRTVLPNGTVIQLKQENIFVKTAVKHGKSRYRTKTAKFSGVVPGAIIDYSYDLVSPQAANYASYTWEIQKILPVLTSRLILKPGEMTFSTMLAGSQHVNVTRESPFKGTTTFTALNVPALASEPMGPPVDSVRARMYFYLPEIQASWLGEMAGRLSGYAGEYIGDAPKVHAKVSELVADQDPPIEKVRKIYQFVQQKIGTEEQRAGQTEQSQVVDPNSVDDVLQRGYADEIGRTLLFLAMVREAGLQGSMMMIAPRDTAILNTDTPDEDQFDAFAAAVKTGGSSWTFYDPAVKHCPFGMISARKEGGVPNAIMFAPQKGAGERIMSTISHTLIPRNRSAAFSIAAVPISSASKNVLMRDVEVKLAGDGSAEIQVSDQGSGLVDLDHRRTYENLDDEKRKEELLGRIHEMLPRAQLVSAEFVDLDSFEKPAVIKYKITISEASSGVADQLLLTPSIFDASSPALFTSDKRTMPVHFPHTQKTVDRIVFEIPQGYAISEMPKPAIVREGPFVMVTNYTKDGNKLVFTRRLEIDAAIWSVEGYPQLKSFFEKVQEADRRLVVLKKGGAS